ncbi:MAG: sterol desaturase family protein [Solirubrobacteraceae bacterium]|nr:MAG: fatty acid hydroxylase [Solirubrobacterales bacterium]
METAQFQERRSAEPDPEIKPPARAEFLAGMSRSEVLKASPPMFDTPWLNRLSRVHPAVVPIIFVPAITLLFAIALGTITVGTALLWALVGYVFWTLTEYWLHRIVFHFEPEQGIGARLHWIIHGVHHDHPSDPMRLVMPPSVSVPLATLFCVAFVAVVGMPAGFAIGAGFLAGYLMYDMTHYYLHHRVPKTALGLWLRELHMRHHFQDHERGFGISAPYWDWVFRTPTRKVARRPAVRPPG